MHRLIRFAIVPLVVLAAFVAFEQSATAHERREVLGGKYQFVVGWRDEPAISNELNSIDLRVTDLSQATPAADSGEATGAPVEGLDMTLTADVIYIDQTRTLELEPRFGQPGAYNGWVIPVQPGDYAFHIYGTINGEEIDETFTPGPETFSPVEDRAQLEFPAPSASSNAAPMGATDSTGGAGGISSGTLVGMGGLIAALGAAIALYRQPWRRPTAALAGSAGD